MLPDLAFPHSHRCVSERSLLCLYGLDVKETSDFSCSHRTIPCLVMITWWSSTDHIGGIGWWPLGLIYHISIMANTFWTANQFSVFSATATTTILYWICAKSTSTAFSGVCVCVCVCARVCCKRQISRGERRPYFALMSFWSFTRKKIVDIFETVLNPVLMAWTEPEHRLGLEPRSWDSNLGKTKQIGTWTHILN